MPGTVPQECCPLNESRLKNPARQVSKPNRSEAISLLQPTPNLQLAMDPRIPDDMEAFSFLIPKRVSPQKTEWIVDDKVAGVTAIDVHTFSWPLSQGVHYAKAIIWQTGNNKPVETPKIRFVVK